MSFFIGFPPCCLRVIIIIYFIYYHRKGEVSRGFFEQTVKYIKENHTNTLEYYLNKGYDIKEARKLLSERQRTFTLEKCIKKYGEIEGTKKYEERHEKWAKQMSKKFNEGTGFAQSMLAKNILAELKSLFPELEYEYTISRYSFDGKYKNKLIEINGDYFHCNPELYERNFYNKINKKHAWQIWEKDKKKITLAKQNVVTATKDIARIVKKI